MAGGKKKSRKKEKRVPKKQEAPERKPTGLFRFLEELPFRYQFLTGIVLLVIAICVLYPELVFRNKIFLALDTQAAASFAEATKQMPAGEANYPLWNPFLFSGMPSFGSLAYMPHIYPVSEMFRAVRTFMPLPNAIWLLFHTFLLGLGVFLLLRDRGVGFFISVSAACFMMWMPNLVAVGAYGHGSQACAVAYLPFALYFWDRIWRGKGIILNASALAIVLGFQMLRAHLQVSYYTYALIGLHFLFFGTLKLVDAARGRRVGAEESSHRGIVARLSGGSEGRPARAATIEVACLAVILCIVVVASLLLSSVLYLPVHDYSQYSIRGATEGGGLDYDYATSWSLHPAEMITFFLPHAYGFGKDLYYGHMPFTDYPNYLGLFVLLGAIGAVLWARDRFTNFLLFVVIVSTLVSFGRFFPVIYDVLFKLLPFFNKFRVPVMVLIVQQLAVVTLFAIGVDALLRMDGARLKKIALWLMLGSFAVFLIAVVSQGYWRGGFASDIAGRFRLAQSSQHQMALAKTAGGFLGGDLLKFSILLSAAFVLLYLYARGILAKAVFIGALALLSFIDLYMVDRHIIHPERFRDSDRYRIVREKSSVDDYLTTDPVAEFLKRDERFFRVFPIYYNPARPASPFSGEFQTNIYMNSGISSIGGYHAAKLANYQEFLGSLRKALSMGRLQLIDMLNVRYLISGYPLPAGEVFVQRWEGQNGSGQKRYVYENLRALPRVFFVDSYRIAEGQKALDLMTAGNIDLSKTAVLAKQPPIEPVSSKGSRAEITRYNLNEIQINAHVDSACIMVLSEVYYPRWQVFVDGKQGEMMQANHILRSVALQPGDHEVVFRYDASLFEKGVLISVLTFAVLVIALLVSAFLEARRRTRWKHSS
ncbi:MAG: YfhO family protein [Candidatus Latescibacteria bacterium]|nr:YfhO family protein [Candidatus Latescibacterota bacterium]NIM21093.1 YfhO family protein [Candidatus Latescibacterota bacterium]NIM65228.1 YfhO family protein [Candidatus Latescibacterota bacterium]NIO01743.1 YfhO family protein [Candidatus Latescibacterota bacterium]NIO28260.1 YfhO family protein [Candidatus Latescibacterota bacterium]